MLNCGDLIRQLLATAKSEVAIIAPFIKLSAVRSLIDACDETVSIKVIGRFRPGDVAHGVCDLTAAELLLRDSRVSFLAHPLLHAKLYRADAQCLVGSANVSLTAFGWTPSPNEELLVEYGRDTALRLFEQQITVDSEVMTWPRLRELQAQAREFPESIDLEPTEPELAKGTVWLPTCRTPRHLFNVYANQDEWRILGSARKAAQADLERFYPLPARLDRPGFEALIRSALRRHPVVQWLTEAGEVTAAEAVSAKVEALARDQDSDLSAPLLWEVLQEWLLYFLPTEFRLVPAETKLTYGRYL